MVQPPTRIVFPFLTKLVAALMIQKVLSQRDQIDLHCVHARYKIYIDGIWSEDVFDMFDVT